MPKLQKPGAAHIPQQTANDIDSQVTASREANNQASRMENGQANDMRNPSDKRDYTPLKVGAAAFAGVVVGAAGASAAFMLKQVHDDVVEGAKGGLDLSGMFGKK
ncbi:MAG TPA: hypothetical protein DHW71_06935 [Gammaproteobacteria bacterium]|mgnify:FL=1|nr:hypothetical protein [Gammaproteobacteria bacterium]MEC8009327.1 hypothetical protein [Pseudomonadota bacterium]HBF07696.1 hypothetical protein [Gammaproteobacteria bacterium]HCK92701.1 hypothetical protein [Gammaproteobacteria bacterium]|tara:strand:- start:738 stop:1052 length:315 start_codon:yes stop_codon:yes gene_type:complete